ncbi:hypothetical protein L596_030646 [Steinernema carpocapsae]|uniref:Uncharacterized protein n=1 Tax=Steinernema carpocapsae TaxID=34508 RepID=A0A4U5LQ21_STECR|nr:hypothetical protein L596_030646 [Steinernema carpocapsae]
MESEHAFRAGRTVGDAARRPRNAYAVPASTGDSYRRTLSIHVGKFPNPSTVSRPEHAGPRAKTNETENHVQLCQLTELPGNVVIALFIKFRSYKSSK